MTYVNPENGSADGIAKSILQYFEKDHFNIENILAIGCDGTNVNVGKFSGVIPLIEKHLGRYGNELPLRHLINIWAKIV